MSTSSEALALFQEAFGATAMGAWSAPGRVNLIGEHTDYTGGFVMPLAIDRRAAIAARPRNDRVVRAVAAGRGVERVDLDEVGAGRPSGWLGYLAGAAWIAERTICSGHGWDLALVSEVPIGAGLSSSAAITCASLLAMDELGGWQQSRPTLARWAQMVEHEVIGMPCGIMDQTAALMCTPGHVLFLDTRSMATVQIPWRAADAGLTLLVTDTRAPHVLADGQYADRRRQCEEAAQVLGVPQLRDADLSSVIAAAHILSADQEACARHVVAENGRVLQVRALLEQDRMGEIGPLLTASHASLRDDFRVTVPQLDVAVDAALSAGAAGARMTGGGFGGCTISLVPTFLVNEVRSSIDAAFALNGWQSPRHLTFEPSAGAQRDEWS